MRENSYERIKELTNSMIAYCNYEKERKVKKEKMRKITIAFMGIFLLVGGAISVDALTDNKISEAIKDVLTIKVDGQDKNAKCEKIGNGNVKCTLYEGLLDGEDITFEYSEKDGKPEVSYEHKPEGDEFTLTINNEITND